MQLNVSALTRPEVEDMLAAGLPLWAALALWNEMQGRHEPAAYWWGRLRSSTPTLQ
jgi:hypothetical protein